MKSFVAICTYVGSCGSGELGSATAEIDLLLLYNYVGLCSSGKLGSAAAADELGRGGW